jgi:hypothetical protein
MRRKKKMSKQYLPKFTYLPPSVKELAESCDYLLQHSDGRKTPLWYAVEDMRKTESNEKALFDRGYSDRWKFNNPKSADPTYLRGWNNADRDAEDLNQANYPNSRLSV